MTVKPQNLLFLISDQHNRSMSGCYGHPLVKTPNLDALAASGVRFNNAYCNFPICVPSRASLATGRYAHELHSWDNASPYTGQAPSWGHRLIERGHKVTTIGKLHFRDPADDTGFPDQRIPMHVYNGVGELSTLIRTNMRVRPHTRDHIVDAHVGESSYTAYSRATADGACDWIRNETKDTTKPWVLFVSLASPHPPWIAPPEFAQMYPPESVPLPVDYGLGQRHGHPVLDEMRRVQGFTEEFDEEVVRRATATYYALCTFIDAQIGKVLETLEETGLTDSTRILYTSDHGESLGTHGLWGKCTMYEGPAAVPFILSGPEVPKGLNVDTPVSLVDCFPTILEGAGIGPDPADHELPGSSLFDVLRQPPQGRTVFSEYHASSSCTGYFMIRRGRYKYVEYVGYPPQLFDLERDPDELIDLGVDLAYQSVVKEYARYLREVCDPEEVDRQAHEDQRRMIEMHGGEAVLRSRPPSFTHGTPAPPQFPRAEVGEGVLT